MRDKTIYANNKIICIKREGIREEEKTNKVEAQVQQAFLNMLYEQGILTDKVCTLAMRRIAEGA